MNRSLYIGGLGMMTQMKSMDVVSNNIANVNTTGYKQDSVATRSFDEEFLKRINDNNTNNNAGASLNPPFYPNLGKNINPPKIGNLNLGLTVDEVFTKFGNGGLQQTANNLDLALDGDGFFAVQKLDANGEATEMYTRDGSFTVDNLNRLMTKDGHFVLGQDGTITLSSNAPPIIDEDGAIIENGTVVDTIKIITVENKDYFRKFGENLYSTLDGAEIVQSNALVRQGYVESSNVNSAREMVNLINISRLYEANQKVVTTSDTLLGKAVNDIARRV